MAPGRSRVTHARTRDVARVVRSPAPDGTAGAQWLLTARSHHFTHSVRYRTQSGRTGSPGARTPWWRDTGPVADVISLPAARGNAILDGLGDEDLTVLAAHLRPVLLDRPTVLYEAGRPIADVYFPIEGVVSVVTEMQTGEVVEVATIGCEGMVGIAVFLGPDTPTERALVQVSGHGLRMGAEEFRRQAAVVDGPLSAVLRRYTQSLFTQLARNGACNHVHPVRQRAARWLLMSADRMDRPTFDLTQEFLAQMLSVRRATVSEVAQALAEDGCIQYTRGTITILDPARLRAQACECYEVIRASTRWPRREPATRAATALGDPGPAR